MHTCRYALILSLVTFLVNTGTSQAVEEQPVSEWQDIAAVRQALKMQPTETAVFVGDMHCANCAKRVSRKLYGVKGVVKIRTNLKVDVAIVTPQRGKVLDAKALWKAAEASGIQPIKLVGPSGVMEADSKTKAAARQPREHDANG